MPASPIDRWRVLSRRNTKRYGNHDRRRRVEVILGRSRTDPQNSGTTGRIHALVRITSKPEVSTLLSRLHQPRQHQSRRLISTQHKAPGRLSSATFGERVVLSTARFRWSACRLTGEFQGWDPRKRVRNALRPSRLPTLPSPMLLCRKSGLRTLASALAFLNSRSLQ
jgi:hypothetical protein